MADYDSRAQADQTPGASALRGAPFARSHLTPGRWRFAFEVPNEPCAATFEVLRIRGRWEVNVEVGVDPVGDGCPVDLFGRIETLDRHASA